MSTVWVAAVFIEMTANFGRGVAICLVTLLLLAMFAFISVQQMPSPEPATLSAPVTEFSSARAFKHLEVIARKPHPVQSPEHAEVRNYIVSELRRIGLDPEIQETTLIDNIVVKLKGTGTEKAILLVGHYDTVPFSPGAADDGSAVVLMLETLRSLKADTPLARDVICLFSDGEEVGLMGAKAFVYSHPWAKDVGLVLNFEARGNSGPAVMFETSTNNVNLIEEFAKAAPYPIANSLSSNIYRLLPNDTDLTIFIEADMTGLNFAFIKGLDHYHSPQDSVDNLDQRSLQHQGSYALALTRYFGNLSSELPASQGNAVYFNTFGSHLVVYSEKWIKPLAALISMFLAGLIVFGLKRKRLAFSGLAKGMALTGLNLIAVLVAITLLWLALKSFLSQGPSRGSIVNADLAALGLASVAVIAAAFFYWWSLRIVSVNNVFAGGLIWWLLLLWMTSVLLPGGSYLFTWPLLFNLVGLNVLLLSRQRASVSPGTLALLFCCTIPGLFLFTPLVYLTLIAFSLQSFLSVVVIVLPAVLLLMPLVPHLSSMQSLTKSHRVHVPQVYLPVRS